MKKSIGAQVREVNPGAEGHSQKDSFSGVVSQIINPKNLALLQQSDRFVVMGAGLVVVAALGTLTALRNAPTTAAVIAGAAMLIVAGLVVLVQWRAFSMKGVEADLLSQAVAADSVNGEWWQLVFSDDHPGLTYVSICISQVAERHAMHGVSLDKNGRRLARWSSDAVAIKTSTPVELYYVWRGTRLEELDTVMVSGLGRFRFDSVGRENRPMQAEGAITRGSTIEMNFNTPRAIELIRFTEQESRRLQEDPSLLGKLAIEAFERFGVEEIKSFRK